MKKFLVLYYAPVSAMEQMQKANPEQAKEGMQKWMEWAKKCGDALIDLGRPLGNGQRVSKAGSTSSESHIVGYSMLQTESMEAAKKLLEGHPHLWMDTCSIEIHETLSLPS